MPGPKWRPVDDDCGAVGNQSLLRGVEDLCSIQIKKHLRHTVSYTRRQVPQQEHLRRLKNVAFEALLTRKRDDGVMLGGDLLSSKDWDADAVTHAVAFRMRTRYRRFYDADKLEELAGKLLEGGDKFEGVLTFLLHLSDPQSCSTKSNCTASAIGVPNRNEIKNLASWKGPLFAGDYPYRLYHSTYTLYPGSTQSRKAADQPMMYPQKCANADQDMLYAKEYSPPRKTDPKNNGSLLGLQSDIFGYKGLTDSSYEFDSQTRLYGGLRHSRTSTLDITLSYPKITGPIDMLASIRSNMTSVDEGFVSPSSSFELSDLENDLSPRQSSRKGEACRMILPYHGYRFPDYDLNLWKECLTVKKSFHRTWETLGLPGGATRRRLYLTEAGSKIFDTIWQQRCRVIYNLANFLNGGKLPPLTWAEANERKLVEHATLVMMGVASDTYQFNKLGQMLLPCRNIFFSGVDPEAVHSLLSRFGEWGTCYRRLLHFSASSFLIPQSFRDSYGFPLSQVSHEEEGKGVVFKAFAGAVRRYLHEYQHQILSLNVNDLTLQELAFKLRRAGAQIRYLCRLCNCGTPDMPPMMTDGAKDFPEGVALLSYLYDEAVHCPEPNHYLVLLYLLRKSCLPYLQFVQDWVFRGKCWDARGEFMLKVNADYGGARKDRQRWLKYVEPTSPDDPGSCVPSFLSSLANEIYVCGKTVALMQFICPEHFLGVHGVNTPGLEISFSKRKLREIENEWNRHEMRMSQLENERTTHWSEKERQIKASAHEIAKLVREAAREDLKRVREVKKLEREERLKVKRIELDRLKRQAEEDAERRALAVQTEKDEDKRREAEVQRKDKKRQEKENKLLQEEKEKLISYYDDLNAEAERRVQKATWATQRQRLYSKRLEHLAQQKTFWENAAQKGPTTPMVPDVSQDARPETNSTPENLVLQSGITSGIESKKSAAEDEPMDSTGKGDTHDILQDFLNATIASQTEEVVQHKKENSESELDKALRAISNDNVASGVIGQGQKSPRPQTAPGMHHVSEETISATDACAKSRMVPGKNVTDSSFAPSGALGPGTEASVSNLGTKVVKQPDNHTQTPSVETKSRMVAGKRVSDSSFAPSGAFGSANEGTGIPASESVGKVVMQPEHASPPVVDVESALSAISYRTVEGKNVSDSNIGTIMGLSSTQDTPVVPQKLGKKSVPGHNITETSLSPQNLSIPGDGSEAMHETPKLGKKMVPGHCVTDTSLGADLTMAGVVPRATKEGVSKSSMGDILQATPPTTSAMESARRVKGCSISDSTMGSLLNTSPDLAQPTVQNVPHEEEHSAADQVHRKKKVAGQDISASTVGDLMKSEDVFDDAFSTDEDTDRLRRFAIQNLAHTGHHSKSSIQNLMYYEGYGPQNWGKVQTAGDSKVDLRPSINSSKRHPSYSTLQLILYPQEAAEDVEVKPVEKSFQLQLPPMDGYCDVLQNVIQVKASGKPGDANFRPMDPIGNVVGKSLEYEFEDKVFMESGVDWRADIDAVEMHALPVLLSQCVVKPITQQVALANRCIVNHFMVDLELPRHFEMLRHFCFMEDGEFGQILSIQLFEKIHSGCRPIEILNPVVLGSLITQAVQGSAQRNSPHAEKLTFTVQHLPPVFSTNDPSSLDCFTLKYDIGWPCNIVVTENNEAKYGQVFGFLLKLKHTMWALHDVVTKLMKMGATTSLSEYEIRQLHLYRHEMHNFVKVMQGYVSTQVVHVCWHEFQDSLKRAKCLEDLHLLHSQYLRSCVFRCLLTKKTERVMNVIMDVFKIILRFWTQLSSKSVSFAQFKHTYDNFKKYAGFLFKVVSKLVDRGYQPHLEDLLVRLNFNGFYND